MSRYHPGSFIKAVFEDEKSGESEWMFAKVERAHDALRVIFGRVESEPIASPDLKLGMELAVSYDNIRDHRTPTSFNRRNGIHTCHSRSPSANAETRGGARSGHQQPQKPRAAAESELVDYVRRNWNAEMEGEGPPDDGQGMVDRYFEHVLEAYEITESSGAPPSVAQRSLSF